MQVQNKHDKAPHASCSLAQIIVNNYDKHMARILRSGYSYCSSTNSHCVLLMSVMRRQPKPYVYSSRAIRHVVIGPA